MPKYLGLCCCLLQYLLLTDNPEKLPGNKWCDVGSTSPACSPGFFQPHLPAAAEASKLLPDMQMDKPRACCAGFFCPSGSPVIAWVEQLQLG